jgi:hypothetical protein
MNRISGVAVVSVIMNYSHSCVCEKYFFSPAFFSYIV